MNGLAIKAKMDSDGPLRYVDCRLLMESRRDDWRTPQEDVECSKVILAADGNVRSRFLKRKDPKLPQPPQPPAPPPDPISSCEDKILKLKQLLKTRKTQNSDVQPIAPVQSDSKIVSSPVDSANSADSSNFRIAAEPEIYKNTSSCETPDAHDKFNRSFQMCTSATYEDEFEKSVEKICRKPKKNRKRRNDKKPARQRVGDVVDKLHGDVVVVKKRRQKRNKRNKDKKSELIEEHPTLNVGCDIRPTCSKPEMKKPKNVKLHRQRKHFKSDPTAPVYFCPDTSKLFTNKKSHKNNKKKLDLWSVNTLVEKYISFLKKGNRRTEVAAPQSSGKSLKNLQFDEARGKFLTDASDNESGDDAFAIVFTDGEDQTDEATVGRPSRAPRVSECDSEDSFVICFDSDCENNPECTLYATDEVFDDSWTSDDDGDDESSDDEEGPTALKSCMKKSRSRGSSPKKRMPKTVSFDPAPPQVHKMEEWKLEYQLARIGHWQGLARDADRFRQRIVDLSMSLEWVFKKEHRNRVFFQRFRPILMRQQREEKEAKAKLKKEVEARALLVKNEEAQIDQLDSANKENIEKNSPNILNNEQNASGEKPNCNKEFIS